MITETTYSVWWMDGDDDTQINQSNQSNRPTDRPYPWVSLHYEAVNLTTQIPDQGEGRGGASSTDPGLT